MLSLFFYLSAKTAQGFFIFRQFTVKFVLPLLTQVNIAIYNEITKKKLSAQRSIFSFMPAAFLTIYGRIAEGRMPLTVT